MTVGQAAPQIQLLKMPQLTEAVSPRDDWTGLTDAALRRKRQNRLNVRAYRRRKARDLQAYPEATSSSITPHPSIPCWNEDQQAVLHVPASVLDTVRDARTPLISTTPNRTKLDSIVFPLSSDHLIILLQYNVLRGLLMNRQLLSNLALERQHDDECSSAALHVLPESLAPSLETLPRSLHPTYLQCTVPHEQWIDIIPHPVIRDNLIRAAGSFDEDALWSDTIGGLFEGFSATEIELRGVVMWSPPWDVSGWEVSEGFWRRWGWSLRGCNEILDGTNRWRRQRGEKPLRFDG